MEYVGKKNKTKINLNSIKQSESQEENIKLGIFGDIKEFMILFLLLTHLR